MYWIVYWIYEVVPLSLQCLDVAIQSHQTEGLWREMVIALQLVAQTNQILRGKSHAMLANGMVSTGIVHQVNGDIEVCICIKKHI